MSTVSRELELLRILEEKLIERRAYEPKHSNPDHECVECEVLAELRQIRRL